jgi:hypothetical protein
VTLEFVRVRRTPITTKRAWRSPEADHVSFCVQGLLTIVLADEAESYSDTVQFLLEIFLPLSGNPPARRFALGTWRVNILDSVYVIAGKRSD